MQQWGALRVLRGLDLDIEVGVLVLYDFEINSGVVSICGLQNMIDLRKRICLCSTSGLYAKPLLFAEVSTLRDIRMILEKFPMLRFGLHPNFKRSNNESTAHNADHIDAH